MRKAPSAFTNGRKSTHLLSHPTSGSTQRLGDGGIRTGVAAEGAGEQASASRRRRDANVAKHALQDRAGWLRQNPMLDADHGEAPPSVVKGQNETPSERRVRRRCRGFGSIRAGILTVAGAIANAGETAIVSGSRPAAGSTAAPINPQMAIALRMAAVLRRSSEATAAPPDVT